MGTIKRFYIKFVKTIVFMSYEISQTSFFAWYKTTNTETLNYILFLPLNCWLRAWKAFDANFYDKRTFTNTFKTSGNLWVILLRNFIVALKANQTPTATKFILIDAWWQMQWVKSTFYASIRSFFVC